MTNLALKLELQENERPSVGYLLKEARLSQGLSLEEIAKTLCISKRHLIHLEEDQENLICDVYTLGFLKSYVQYLGLDEKNLSKMFKQQAINPPPSDLPFPVRFPGKGNPSRRILSFSFLILLAVVVGWEWAKYTNSQTNPPQDKKIAEVLPESKTKPVESVASQNPSPLSESLPPDTVPKGVTKSIENLATEPPAIISPQSVLLKATEEAWIEVTTQEGNIILTRTLRPGETFELKHPKNLVLKTGNAGGVSLVSGGKSIPSLGKSGEVKREVSLDPEKWVEQSPETH